MGFSKPIISYEAFSRKRGAQISFCPAFCFMRAITFIGRP